MSQISKRNICWIYAMLCERNIYISIICNCYENKTDPWQNYIHCFPYWVANSPFRMLSFTGTPDTPPCADRQDRGDWRIVTGDWVGEFWEWFCILGLEKGLYVCMSGWGLRPSHAHLRPFFQYIEVVLAKFCRHKRCKYLVFVDIHAVNILYE